MRARRGLRRAVLVLAVGAGAGLVGWRVGMPDRAATPVANRAPASARPHILARGPDADGGGAAAAVARGGRRQLIDSLQRADQLYCSYRSSSRYPPGSRPMAQNADQDRPNDAIASTSPMVPDGGAQGSRQGGGSGDEHSGGVQLQTAQSRVWLAAGETVAFTLRAVDGNGHGLPLVVTRALAQGITYAGTRQTPQVALSFADDGSGADRAAGDGSFAAVLAPGETGLAGFDGTIRTEVRYHAGGNSGVVQFDVIHTPVLPAVWDGPVRDAVEDGSLAYHLQLDVRQGGRYIINGRVDDAHGQPVALLTFNDVLGPGPNDVRLTLFGKLLRDAASAQPLTLRDVDGWLLKENTDPDRAILPRLEGRVFTGRAHEGQAFSEAEWQSEERSRYLAEFARDVNAARARLAAFDPSAPLPASACLPAVR
jgi:hypothetical protein